MTDSDYLGCFHVRMQASGHGTHTAATAAGNYGAVSPFTPPGALLSGMAPRARIAVYKVRAAVSSCKEAYECISNLLARGICQPGSVSRCIDSMEYGARTPWFD